MKLQASHQECLSVTFILTQHAVTDNPEPMQSEALETKVQAFSSS